MDELAQVKKKYAVPRRTEILYDYQAEEDQGEEDETPDYPVNLFLSQEGYFKKITPQSLRMASDQKYKEGDGPWLSWEGTNRDELLVFTDKQQCYKTRMSDFDDAKGQRAGRLPAHQAGHGPGGAGGVGLHPRGLLRAAAVRLCQRQGGAGGAVRPTRPRPAGRSSPGPIPTRRPWRRPSWCGRTFELAVYSSDGRCMVFHTALLAPKTTRTTQGVNVMTLKPKRVVEKALPLGETAIVNAARYRARSLPVAGALLKEGGPGGEADVPAGGVRS